MPLLDLVAMPVRLAAAAAETTLALGHLASPEGPVRRPGGYAERVMLIIGEGGLVERLAAVLTDPTGPMSLVDALAAATAEDRALGRALAPGGTIDRLVVEDGPLHRLLQRDSAVDRLLAEGGTLDQVVALGDTLEAIQPRLAELAGLVPELHASVEALNRAVEPLGGLANRIPRGRRRSPAEV